MTALEWSADGRRLLVLSPQALRVYGQRGALGTLLEIVEAIKQFARNGPSARDDLKTIRALNRTLVKDGKGRMRPAFGEQSAVALIEREIRYGVTRSIQILDSRLTEPGDHATMDGPEPWLVLEHAHDLLRTNVDTALQRPLDLLTDLEGPISFWDELRQFAFCQGLDEQVDAFRSRPLEGGYPYLWLDAKVEKVRDGGRVVRKCLVLAYGVHESGYREVIGLDVGECETEAFWRSFLRSLVKRGLTGVELVVSDAQGFRPALGRLRRDVSANDPAVSGGVRA